MEEIDYIDIMAMGFLEVIQDDEVYFHKYGFDYSIITKELTAEVSLDWDKVTRTCEIIRYDENLNVISRKALTVAEVNIMVAFFGEIGGSTPKPYNVPDKV